MESQVEAPISTNGVEKIDDLSQTDVVGKKDVGPSVGVKALTERRAKMVQGLNNAKSQREALSDRLKEVEVTISRTEGAIITLEGLIQEIDPEEMNRIYQQGG